MLKARDVDGLTMQIYRYVVRNSGCGSEDVERALGVPSLIVEDRLDRLQLAGLLAVGMSGDIRVLPTGPDVMFERLRAGVEFEYAQRKQELTELHDRFSRLFGESLAAADDAHPVPMDVLSTTEAGYVHILNLARSARREVLHMWTGLHGSLGSWQEIVDVHASVMRRGVDVRMICPSHIAAAVRPITTMPIRAVAAPPLEMHIFDRRVSIIDDDRAVFFIVRGQVLVHVMHAFFENWWAMSQNVEGFSEQEPNLPSNEDRTLLHLLGAGVKDEKIARRMGLSVRTVRRKIASLMDSLEATSRFEAGVVAARRGWV
ncbi:LuxR C-terminal-related transcriptional regulator [Kibdelosporangium aridum]|uniref:LuxR C-terminal-related transcriptional regulator n=1 Tax=Kibdelosporangium aridum TaxID=2030 RepID=UPI0035E72AFB